MINNDALSAVLKRERYVHLQPPPPRRYCAQRLSSEGLSVSRAQQTFLWSIFNILHLRVSVLEGFVCKCVTDLIWFDLQQNRMLLNQNVNSNVGLLVHSREAICSKSWISFLWNQDRKYQLGRIATVLVFEQINLEIEKVQIGFTEFAKSL